jgi:hypothetical protein
MDDMLKSLLRKTSLEDTEFLVNLGDWPLSAKKRPRPPVAIFSWCGSDDTFDIVLPTYELSEATLNMQGRVSVDILSVLGKQSVAFEDKMNQLYWRGRDSNRARLDLVLLSKARPELINASLTNFFFFRDEMERFGPIMPYTKFWDFFHYKYQLNLDGTVAAYRLPMLLAGSSLVLKQKSKYYEHFYHLLQSNTHFLGVEQDLSDLLSTLELLVNSNGSRVGSHSDLASNERQKTIVENANQFILQYLLPEKVYCYYYKAITDYTKLLGKRVVKLREDMELIEQKEGVCNCEFSDQVRGPKTRTRNEL